MFTVVPSQSGEQESEVEFSKSCLPQDGVWRSGYLSPHPLDTETQDTYHAYLCGKWLILELKLATFER